MKKMLVMFVCVLALTVSSSARAENYQIKEMTPAVKQVLDARRARYNDLKTLKDSGTVGENNKGYVEVLTSSASADAVVKAENKDRRVLYQTIVEQNNLPADALATVENVFAQVQQDKAGSGEMIQTFGGKWIKK